MFFFRKTSTFLIYNLKDISCHDASKLQHLSSMSSLLLISTQKARDDNDEHATVVISNRRRRRRKGGGCPRFSALEGHYQTCAAIYTNFHLVVGQKSGKGPNEPQL